jgi:uncharacterized Zn finger protein
MNSDRRTGKNAKNPFLSLTWFDIETWAGSKVVSRGKSYQRSGYVKDFGITSNNELVAWVQGTKSYATKVGFNKGKLSSVCTCPYRESCKHAVALVVEYLERMKAKKEVQIISPDDKRINKIASGNVDWPDDSEGDEENGSNDESLNGEKSMRDLKAFIKSQTEEQLAAILSDIAESNPEIQRKLKFKAGMSSKSMDSLVKSIRAEINRVSDEPGWYDYRRHIGHTPDYSSVISGLEKLMESGHADEAMKLGEYLLKMGMEAINQSSDENETVDAVADAMSSACDALKASSLQDVDKMEKAINWEMECDGFGLCNGLEKFWKKRFTKKDWSDLADRLLKRLNGLKAESGDGEFRSRHYRNELTDRIIEVLTKAGREDEIVPLCVQEAGKTGGFERVVKRFRKAGNLEKAEEWIHKGLAAADGTINAHTGTLARHLLEIRTEKRDWLFVAAIKAFDFFDRPSLETFKELKKSAERAKVLQPVQNAAMKFLQTGKEPKLRSAEWPLPDTGLAKSERYRFSLAPYISVLIDIALSEKNIDEALRLYDGQQGNGRKMDFSSRLGVCMDNTIADAIKAKYPDRSVELWKQLAEHHIGFSNQKAYAQAGHYLRKIRKALESSNKTAEWNMYLGVLRAEHARKGRLMEVLDSIAGKPIVEG